MILPSDIVKIFLPKQKAPAVPAGAFFCECAAKLYNVIGPIDHPMEVFRVLIGLGVWRQPGVKAL